MIVFLFVLFIFSFLDRINIGLPFEGNLNAGYLAQSGNTKSSSLTADTAMTWYGQRTAWSLWGN
ncbi:hypothetical protein MJL33_32455, partial [Salmonella enterica subsp. enterica serovar Kentucky]|nr:hypothetical protein [Salmonella enterica subsp. enterica serovar Kentucky]